VKVLFALSESGNTLALSEPKFPVPREKVKKKET
jgi:hypothetical protein